MSPMTPQLRGRSAMTLIEIVFAVGMFSLFGVGTVLAITNFNRLASLNRYHTLALAAAQQKIDQVMATPWSVHGARPAILNIGTVTESATASPPVTLPLNNDSYNSTRAGCSSQFSGLDTQILDSRVTTVTAIPDYTTPTAQTGASSRLLQVSVTVTYTYCGKFQTTITLNTIRAADDF